MTDSPTPTLEELFARATAGPWSEQNQVIMAPGPSTVAIVQWGRKPEDEFNANAALIVALVNQVPAILKEREELRADLEARTSECERLKIALRRVSQILTIPAAEYVPAIPETWAVIEEALR